MNIYCIGRNYVEHAKELGNEVPTTPLVFLSTESSLRGFESTQMAFAEEEFAYEAEIILKIEKDHKLNEKYTKDSVESIALGLDITRRGEQSVLKDKGYPWTSAKSFLGSKLVGKFISHFDLSKPIEFQFLLNDELKQVGKTELMIFSFEEIINFLNSFSPLKKGDLIYTGTPVGVGPIKVGDKFDLIISDLDYHEKGTL